MTALFNDVLSEEFKGIDVSLALPSDALPVESYPVLGSGIDVLLNKKMEAIVARAKENKCFVVGENPPVSSDSDLEEGFFPQPDPESPGQSLADMGSSAFHSPYAMCLMMQNEQEKAMEEDRTESSNNFCAANKLVREHLKMIEHSPNLQNKYMAKLQEAGNELEEELAARKHGNSDSPL